MSYNIYSNGIECILSSQPRQMCDFETDKLYTNVDQPEIDGGALRNDRDVKITAWFHNLRQCCIRYDDCFCRGAADSTGFTDFSFYDHTLLQQ